MTEDRSCGAASQRGFVIVAVLWILVALSSLAMIFSVYLSVSAHALAVGDDALRTEALVSTSAELTAYRLSLARDKKPSHGSFHFRMDDADVAIVFLSEAARIDLNFAPKEILAGLFAGLGASKQAAADQADRIVGWRTRPVPGSANDEEAFYASAGLGYAPRQSLFTHVNELALVAGLPPVLVELAGMTEQNAAIVASGQWGLGAAARKPLRQSKPTPRIFIIRNKCRATHRW